MTNPPKKIPTIRLLLLAVLLTAVNAAAILDPDRLPADILPMINLILGVFLAMETLWLARTPKSKAPPPAAAPAPTPKISREERTRHELARFLGLFQEKGRLVDFLMEDLAGQPDERVGQVARVVHQGCKSVLDRHFDLSPVQTAEEGKEITLEEGLEPESVRLVGSVKGGPPFTGILLHRGWRTTKVDLPEISRELPDSSDSYPVAPAEVELR